MNNLAALHATNGQYELAEDIRLDLLEISREDFGELHWRTGSAYESLGILKIHSGNMERAAEFFEKATEIYTDTLGGDHIWTERTMLYYSLSRFNSNESQVAKSQFHEAFESLKEKRIYFSRYDVEVMNHLINNFKPYPSISTSPDFARLEEIK
jgi:tetratricopeptide (TPR) repeat protein